MIIRIISPDSVMSFKIGSRLYSINKVKSIVILDYRTMQAAGVEKSDGGICQIYQEKKENYLLIMFSNLL